MESVEGGRGMAWGPWIPLTLSYLEAYVIIASNISYCDAD